MSATQAMLYGVVAGSLGCIFAVFVPKNAGRAISFASLGIGGILASVAGLMGLIGGTVTADLGPHVALRIDRLAGFFLVLIGCVTFLTALYNVPAKLADERRSGRTAAAAANAIFVACVLACIANDVLLFLFAWELLGLASYWAVAFAGTERDAPRAGYITLVVTHAAGAALLTALLILAHAGGGFGVHSTVLAGTSLVDAGRGVVFLLLLIGFGAKIGMIPMQAWMPLAYRAAPSGISALMAGAALNVGFYGIARFMIPLGGSVPAWWAIIVLALGGISALAGIAWGSAERDARTLAAYSSVENGGVILAAFGVALAGRALHNDMLYGLGMAAALLQIIAHAFAKTAIFMVCSTLRDRCGSTNFEQLGGLARSMPLTTLAALTAALSLAALPPFAGFASEWLVLESMMQAFRTGSPAPETALAVCGAIVGLAAGISVVAFVKFVGIGLLGAARSQQALEASETRFLVRNVAVALSALALLVFGVFSRSVVLFLAPVVAQFGRANAGIAIAAAPFLLQPAFPGFSSASPLGLLCLIGGFSFMFWAFTKIVRRPGTRRTPVWTSGERYYAWTQYTGTGFANPTRVILDAIVRPVRTLEGDTYQSRSRPFFGVTRYAGIARIFLRAADQIRATQSGVIASYLAYILGFTILVLLFYPSLRNW